MDQMPLVLLVAAAAIGIVAVVAITRRSPAPGTAGSAESPFAAATEGMKRCPSCGTRHPPHFNVCPHDGSQLLESDELVGTIGADPFHLQMG